jgi:adenosylcobyric acid synthase
VVRLPMISNFTDFDALSLEEGVKVIYVRTPDELGSADAIIIPGTKNTMQDLLWLRESGMASAISAKVGTVPVLGICGGYQMLGRKIFDIHGLEGSGPSEIEGMGLLDALTHFDSYDKRTVQVLGCLANGEGEVRGYEIHMGRTERQEEPLFRLRPDGREEGSWNRERKVLGTYLHGVFDLPAFRSFFLSMIEHRDPERTNGMDHDAEIDSSLDRLAAMVEEHLDIDGLLRGDGDGP